MKKKKVKNKNKDIGFISGNGICIDGDILLSCEHEHTARSYLWLQIIIAFVATLSTAAMARSFLDMDIYLNPLIYYSALMTVVFGLMKSKHNIVKFSALGVFALHIVYMITNWSNIRYGMFVVIDRYLSRANQPNSTWGVQLNGISLDDYPYLASSFFVLLITIIALGIAAACIYRIDFPLLFIMTFPVFELGMYWGWEPSMWTVIGLFICWVIILAMHIINHTTNKAGRKNTFAVHERKRTFYFTSEEKKSCFYAVYIKYIAALCGIILGGIIIISKVTGFTRPEVFTKYRHDISTAVANFSLEDLRNAFSDYDGGFDLFGIKTVGGTNGGVLGTTEGISFNGSTALKIEVPAFDDAMYLRGYVAGYYENNTWTPIDVNEDNVKFDDYFNASDLWVQDMNYDILNRKYGDSFGISTIDPKEIKVSVLGASKKFVYAPYSALYSSDGNTGKERMRPTTESYVKLSATKYSLFYYNPFDLSSNYESLPETITTVGGIYSEIENKAFDEYDKFVREQYLEVSESEALDRVYNEIVSKYLGGYSSEYSYYEVANAIKDYFAENFTYTLEPGITPSGEDFIEYFLDVQKEGYCSYFATAGVELLRKFGFPARYVEGYMVLGSQLGTEPNSSGTYEVTVKDKCAHAWAEVYIKDAGWYPAEFTPGYDNDNPNLTDKEKDPTSVSTVTTTTTNQNPATTKQTESKSSITTKPNVNNGTAKTTTKKTDSSSSSSYAGGLSSGTNSGSTHNGTSSEDNKKPVSGTFKGMLISVIGLVAILAVVVLRRKMTITKIQRELSEGESRERAMKAFTYMLKYLKLAGISGSRNRTDLQLCDELIAKCREKGHEEMTEAIDQITKIAVKAHMSDSEITSEETDLAVEELERIKDAVQPLLSGMDIISAKFVYCLY